MKKREHFGFERTVDLLRKMHSPNCGVKFKSKKESLQYMLEKYEEYRVRGEDDETKARLLKAAIDASVKVS